MINLKGNFIKISQAVGDVSVLARVGIRGLDLVDLRARRFVLIEGDFFGGAVLEDGVVVVRVDDQDSNLGR